MGLAEQCRRAGLERPLETPNLRGDFPLTIAVQHGQLACVYSLLLAQEATLDAGDRQGNTPLHHACVVGMLRMVELLLRAGALVNAENSSGETPLHVACANNHPGVVKLLMERGARVTGRTRGGYTALHYCAASESMHEIAKALVVEGGVPAFAITEKGQTALAIACQRKNFPTADFLGKWNPHDPASAVGGEKKKKSPKKKRR